MLRRALISIATALSIVMSPAMATPVAAATERHVYSGQSLQSAITSAAAGDTVVVHDGSFPAVVVTNKTWSTPVQVVAASGATVVVDSFNLTSVSGLTVRGMNITNSYSARWSSVLVISESRVGKGVLVRDGIDNLTVSRNRIDGGSMGIWVWNSATSARNRNITISGNEIYGQTDDNIQVGAADNLVVEDNLIHDAVENDNHNDGIQVMGSEGAVIRRNRFWNHDQAILLKAEPYLGAGNRVADVRVENNVVHNERGAGIIVAGTVNASIVNNTGYDNRFADVHIVGDNNNLRVWNNVLNQIWKGGSTLPAFEDYNCVQANWQPGPHDITTTLTFVDRYDYRLTPGHACQNNSLSTGAPSDDLGGNARTGTVTPGAWQAGSSSAGTVAGPPAGSPPSNAGSTPPAPSLSSQAYWMARTDADTSAFGVSSVSNDPMNLNAPVVGMAASATGNGYYLVGRDGGVFTFGDAKFFGSTGSMRLNQPIVGMASAPVGEGYWFVASDGGVFTFGDIDFHGSTGSMQLNKPIVGMAATPTGKGYWLVASDGGIFSFGDAKFHGSTGSLRLNKPIVGMTATPSGDGYWLVASDGGIFSFGDAKFHGSTGSLRLNRPIVGMARTPSGKGYWLAAADGGIFNFGDATFQGSWADLRTPSQVVVITTPN